MAATTELPFTCHVAFDPSADFEVFLRGVPAKWVIYLMCDEQDQPVQLLSVKNLRASLKRRLGGDEPMVASRRVNYRELIRHVHYLRVDSALEADWHYYEAARVVFPQTYQGMTGFRPAWFVHVNPDSTFPRYIKTTSLSIKTGRLVGPIEDKHAAAKLVQLMEDSFDLCRYYSILVQAPNALACAYKEMGKCPAPCDGSISMPQYRQLVQWSLEVLMAPAEAAADQTRRMQRAAEDLRFELAAKIKAYVEQLGKLGRGPFRHAALLDDFRFLSFQPGPGAGTARLLLITPGGIEELLGLRDGEFKPGEILSVALDRSAKLRHAAGLTLQQAERVGIVAHHLFSAKASHGVFLRMRDIDEKAVQRAWRELLKQKSPEESDGEGVLKELQAL